MFIEDGYYMYKVTSSEEKNEKATDFETKSMLYMMNYYSNSGNVEWFVIDFFNDVTGVNKLCTECYDIQSKGVNNIAPKQLGKYLVTLFKNYISEFNFSDYILFVESVSSTFLSQIGNKNVFLISDLLEDTQNAIYEGLEEETKNKTYIDNDKITNENLVLFLKKVSVVIDSHTKEEYVKDAVKLSADVIIDDKILRKIFKEIRDKQSNKKNNNAEGHLISSIGGFHKFDKHIKKEAIQDFIMNTICFKSALLDFKSIPRSFQKFLNGYDETIENDIIEDCQNAIFRLLHNKNNISAYWALFSEVVKLIKSNPTDTIDDIYNKLDSQLITNTQYLDMISSKYYISLIKERIE